MQPLKDHRNVFLVLLERDFDPVFNIHNNFWTAILFQSTVILCRRPTTLDKNCQSFELGAVTRVLFSFFEEYMYYVYKQ